MRSEDVPGPEAIGPEAVVAEAVAHHLVHLRRSLEHFLPDAILEPLDGAGPPRWQGAPDRTTWRVAGRDDGRELELHYLQRRYRFRPGLPRAFFPAERRLVEQAVRVLDRRFRAFFDLTMPGRAEWLQYIPEDLIVAGFLDLPAPGRIPAALETLRGAALSTYENRELSTGVLLLGTAADPAAPGRPKPPSMPRYNNRLSALKGIHRICDGLHTLFAVDHAGEVIWPVDVAAWAEAVQGPGALECPCPRPFVGHAKATRSGGHACLVLMPSHEVKVFAGGAWAFAFTHARWRLLDIPEKFASWRRAVGPMHPPDLAARLFRIGLDMADERKGALIVVLRDPDSALPGLVDPGDRIDGRTAGVAADHDHIAPHALKQTLHLLVHGRSLGDLPDSVVESLAGLDGALVTDGLGRLLTFGAILRVPPAEPAPSPVATGARTATAQAVSTLGPVLKVSEDGLLSLFLDGHRLWDV